MQTQMYHLLLLLLWPRRKYSDYVRSIRRLIKSAMYCEEKIYDQAMVQLYWTNMSRNVSINGPRGFSYWMPFPLNIPPAFLFQSRSRIFKERNIMGGLFSERISVEHNLWNTGMPILWVFLFFFFWSRWKEDQAPISLIQNKVCLFLPKGMAISEVSLFLKTAFEVNQNANSSSLFPTAGTKQTRC